MITTATEPSPPDQRNVGAVLTGLSHLSLWRGRIGGVEDGGHAIGRNGKDPDLIVAHRRRHRLPNGESVDLGLVGDVESINPDPLRLLDGHGLIPVIAPIATGRDGATYNVNADHVAGMVAAALGAAVLLQLTDVPGILRMVRAS